MLQVFPCRVQGFPTRYLGAPLSITRLCRANEQALVDSVAARIPTWKAGLLTNAGRATLTQTTLSAIPVHISICCTLSPWAIREIDKRRRVFLWAGTDSVAGGKCRVVWPAVCSPRDLGGLGLPDLRILGGLGSRIVEYWLQTRGMVPEHHRRGFDSLVLLVSWEVWKERNRRTFDGHSMTPTQLLGVIRDEGDSWIAAGFRGLA